jgi:D-aminoacyl-tRNA deacylase
VRGETVARIDRGFLVLVGVGHDEREENARRLAEKVLHLRVFEDEDGKMNLALADVGGSVLVVPQFTLYGDWRKGRRPSWVGAAPPDVAAAGVEQFEDALEALGGRVARGAFGEHMEVELVNDGPVTLLLDSAEL